ncbi:MAG: D-glycero-beta-D-manno-heptose-7-phosphate kinase [Calditrichaeota bacterium]|nr:MAG: D-glycero-beta-D-manno-heptose-7-phosphate kinase [Calditrichota bacterium]
MQPLDASRIQQLIQSGYGKQIVVLGDLMVDRYLWGKVSRISPEAPVPVIDIDDEEIRFGGAANVAYNLISLGARPLVVGVVGLDQWGKIFHSMLLDKNLRGDGLVMDESRPTTLKTRIIGNSQHIARVDRESTAPIGPAIQEKIFQFVASVIDEVEGIIFEDYNKGVLVPELFHRIIELARQRDKFVAVDPKFDHFLEYRGVTLFKPNRKETEEALAMRLNGREALEKAGRLLLERLQAKGVLITLGAEGMALFQPDREPLLMPTQARKVADVSGAGDTVIATLAYALAGGAGFEEAMTLANFAAGLVCEEVGVVPVDRQRLIDELMLWAGGVPSPAAQQGDGS